MTHWQHPRFHAYFPSGNSYPSLLADMLSDAIGCIGFSWVSYPNGPKTKGYWERFCIMTKTDENCLKMDLSIVCMWGYSESCLKKFTSFNQISNESKKFTFFFQAASPSCTELETIVLDWLGKLHYMFYSR